MIVEHAIQHPPAPPLLHQPGSAVRSGWNAEILDNALVSNTVVRHRRQRELTTGQRRANSACSPDDRGHIRSRTASRSIVRSEPHRVRREGVAETQAHATAPPARARSIAAMSILCPIIVPARFAAARRDQPWRSSARGICQTGRTCPCTSHITLAAVFDDRVQ
jgi:hypothetical protein